MISIKELFNDPDEWHVFVLGFADAFLFWDRRTYKGKLARMIFHKEPWYYRAGMVFGFIFFGVFMACLVKVIIL